MKHGMGWVRDLPDFRDHQMDSTSVVEVTKAHRFMGVKAKKAELPAGVDWSKFCSPVEDQGPLGSCTAHAGTGLLEFCERKAFDTYIQHSRLYLYKVTRWLAGDTGDTGAELRTTMKAMRMFGCPPESYYPYDISKYDDEPGPMVTAVAASYKSIEYFRIDQPGMKGADIVTAIKGVLAGGLAVMFGTTLYDSMPMGTGSGAIPIPKKGEKVIGGHAMLLVGYNDNANVGSPGQGHFLLQNSWGKSWGNNGYGWLPYWFVERGLATDFWSLSRAEYVDTGLFN